MLKRLALAAVSTLVLAAPVLFPLAPRKVCTGFLPENDLKIPVGDVNALGISEAEFHAVLDKVEPIYAPIIAAKGAKLVVERKWDDATVNAYAFQQGKEWHIAMFGGLARHQAVTAEGFALVACHEIGHHIGGFPKKSWATNEGGADYYATLKCLRRVFPGLEAAKPLDPTAAAACERLFPAEKDRFLCQAGSMAGLSIANLFMALRPGTPQPKFETPDPGVVSRTNDNHPAAQCRLDTYFQGAVCTASLAAEQSNSDPVPGACTKAAGFNDGLRPRCWYKPPTTEPAAFPLAVSKVELRSEAVATRVSALAGALSSRGL